MRLIVFLPIILMACVNDQSNLTVEKNYQFEEISGTTWVHKNGVVVDSFSLQSEIKEYYLDHIDQGFWEKMKIKVKEDSFRMQTIMDVRDLQTDTIINGVIQLGRITYINLADNKSCDSIFNAEKQVNICLEKRGSGYFIPICFDVIFDDSVFNMESISGRLIGINNIPGMKCSERAHAEQNMYRSELLIEIDEI